MSPKMLLIDGHGVAYRGYHATAHGREIMTTSKGEWTNAVYVFVSKLLKAWREEAPDYIAIAFDAGKTFRHEQYAEYKANRARMPEELRYQFARIYQVIAALGIPSFTCEGYEADDVLGTLSRQGVEEGVDTVIMTGDTDILQVIGDHVQVLIPRGRYGDEMLYGPEQVSERYSGLTPQQLIDLKALVGDTSDNIPGVKGIGEKTAAALLKDYGSIEGIYEHLSEVRSKRVRTALEGHREEALLYKELVTIHCDAPVELDLEQARADNFRRDDVAAVFAELEFHSFMERIPASLGEDGEGTVPPGEDEVEVRYTTVDTPARLDAMIAALETAPAIAFDVETTSTDPMSADLVGVSLAIAPGQAWYAPVGHGRGHAQHADSGLAGFDDLPLFAGQEEEERSPASAEPPLTAEQAEPQLPLALVVERLKPILENASIPKYAHNASYDVTVLAQNADILVEGLTFDTMVAAWVIDPGNRGRGLKALASSLLRVEMTPISDLIGTGKAQITMDQVSIAAAAPYACADADMTLRLVQTLTWELHDRQQWDLFTQLEMPLVPILTRMEMAGVLLDVKYLRQMSAQLDEEQVKIEEQIYEEVGHRFNVRSTKQLSEVLFEELGLPKRGIRRTTHGYSTAADALSLLKGKHPVIDLILEERQISKLKSTYVDTFPALVNPRTGRVHTSYNQTGAITGRLSSSNPNLQNIPIRTELGRQIRKGFIAQDGWLFLAADYSQIELRVLAHVSKDPELLDAFHRDQDVHARTAAAVYGVPIEEVTKPQRSIAKTVNFGLIYGQSAYGLSQQTDLDFDEAERFIAAYFARYPGVKEWLEHTRTLAYAQGYVETLLGRRRYFPELQSTQRSFAGQRAAAERQAINAPIQGTAADILKIAMIRLDRELAERGYAAHMVLQVHDEVVLEVPQSELDQVVALTREVMEGAYALDVPLKVDIEVGENWYDMGPM
ncbi:MAG: DNA polymerase I [Anaerolineae bacterium]|nr:DNA polymerase I [Anaerolineae bacterium]